MMKFNPIKFLLLIIAFVITSCDSDDPAPASPPAVPGATNTEFVIGTNAYVTPNVYLLLDDGTDGSFDREFTFVFSEQAIIEDATNEIAFDTSTNHYTKVTCNIISTTTVEAQIPIFVWPLQNPPTNIIMEGNHYTHTDITSFGSTSSVGGSNYGQVTGSTSYFHTGEPQGSIVNQTNLLTVNSITVDWGTRTGTIDCTYNYDDDNAVNISGTYIGTYEILTAY